MSAASSRSRRILPPTCWIAPLIVIAATVLTALVTPAMATPGRLVLAISVATVLSWALGVAEEWCVGVIAVAALWLAGAVAWSDIVATAADDLILLLVAAFLIASCVERSGLLNAVATRLFASRMTISELCWRLAAVVGLTAFFIPSTSARAAMMLPLHRSILSSVKDAAARRALTLIVPTVILLSAGGVLTGAAAHILALDLMSSSGGVTLGYGGWLVYAAPVAVLSSLAAVWIILTLVAGNSGSGDAVMPPDAGRHLDRRDVTMLSVIAVAITLWMTSGWHGASLAAIGASAAAILIIVEHGRQPVEVAALFNAVDTKILALLISTMVLAKALISSGALTPLILTIEQSAPAASRGGQTLAVAFVTAIAMLAHLVIPSRSARAAVLLPSLALPMASVGLDIGMIALVIVLGTGFCQLVPYGAKPLMIFAGENEPAAFRADIRRVGPPLAVAIWLIILVCALILWPLLGRSGIE